MKRLLDRLRARWAWFDLTMTIVDKGGRDGVGRLSIVLAYWSFFSIFPLLLVAVTVVGTLLEGSWRERILDSAVSQLPSIGNDIRNVVKENEASLSGLGWGTVIGAVGAVWAGTHAFDAYEHAMQVVALGHAERHPGFLWKRLRAFCLMAVFGVGLLATTSLTGYASEVGIPGMAKPVSLLISIAANVALLLLMYEISVPGRQGARRLLPGAMIGGSLLAVLHLVGGWYVDRVLTKADDTYGVFATVIGLLTWVNLIGKIVIWSAEVNSVLADRADTDAAADDVGLPQAISPQLVDGE